MALIDGKNPDPQKYKRFISYKEAEDQKLKTDFLSDDIIFGNMTVPK